MKHFLSAFFVLFFLAQAAFAQTYAIKGKLLDKTTGEALIGASVLVVETQNGTQTDLNGSYKIENVKPGTYQVTASYIGYNSITERVTVTERDAVVTFRLGEDNATLNEVEIVADIAVERETPVAFSAIKESTIRESLAGRDLPLLLNETPGVYATNQGGGPGESRISIRGFSQENIAVMVNGVPVNDMENGRVFWSNWDLGDVTRSTQVQRGLSASKLATPSIGGTMNILTKGFEKKESFIARQEIGSRSYSKTSLMYSSGELPGQWAFTVYGSRRTGDGWVQGTFDDSWSYFGNVSKRMGNHTLSLTGLGSPQRHGRRAFAQKIVFYDTEKAKELGASTVLADGSPIISNGFDYNPHYNELDRWELAGNDTIHNREKINDQQNFYHKPQFNLNHFWTISDKFFVSNVLYASIGNGAGITPIKDSPITFQRVYNNNVKDKSKAAENYLRTLNNNHRWYGFISGLDYKVTEQTTISAGVDGRTYKGEHYSEIYDLLGAEYTTHAGNRNVDPTTKLYKGDKIAFNNDGYVRYIGGFLMTEYKTNVLSAFVSGTVSTTNYRRKDYFLAKRYNVNITQDGNTNTLQIPIAFDNVIRVPKKKPVGSVTDTTLVLTENQAITYNQKTYLRTDMTGKLKESEWVKFTGYTLKGGINYNLNEFNNIFINTGYITKAPFFNNVFNTTTGDQYVDAKNESVTSIEIGYGISRSNFKANLNGYITNWFNRSQSRTETNVETPFGTKDVQIILNGLDARHVGVELEIAQEISRKVSLNAAISLGDWRWQSAGVARRITVDGEFVGETPFDATDVHVGGSAQNQFMLGVRYEPIQGLYIRPTYLLFAKNYADFSPQNLSTAEQKKDSYRLPSSRNIDLHSGYSFKFYKDYKFTLNGSILNVLNEFYITDAPTRQNVDQFNPNFIEVFFNRGRVYQLGASVSF